MKIKKDKRLHITMTPHSFDLIAKEAKRKNISISEYAREAFIEHMARDDNSVMWIDSPIISLKDLVNGRI